jgi:iron uptake system component EfeO
MSRRSVAALLTAGAAVALAGCTSTAPPAAPSGGAASGAAAPAGPITVQAADTACQVSTGEAPAGTITFNITNGGSKVTEFYLYGTGDRIMGEVENIGPGLSRQLIVEVPDGGTYTTECKPGMVGDGIRAPFTVTGAAARSIDTNAKLAEATAGYKRYTTSQIEALVPKTQEFVDAVKAGDVEKAKALYPVARTYWERIEPVAESFGDIDPKVDGRDDGEPGVEFTGFHRLEKDLWQDGLKPDSSQMADRLMADIKDLQARVSTVELTPVQLANGAKELLDEVATGKITGEEDRYSHTDLWDFAANLEGSEAAVQALRPYLTEADPELVTEIDDRFAATEAELEQHRAGDGWQSYDQLTEDQLRGLSDSITALTESVSQVASVVAGK